MCPICYAEEIKRVHGIEWEPGGEMAAEMYELAKRIRYGSEDEHGKD